MDAAFDAFWEDRSGVRTAFAAMWDRMAERHADRPGVIGFEILEYSVALERWNAADLSLVEADGTEATALVDSLARPHAALLAGRDLRTARDADAWLFSWTAEDSGVTELRWPPRLGRARVGIEGGCFEARHDRVLVRAFPGTSVVRVRLARSE